MRKVTTVASYVGVLPEPQRAIVSQLVRLIEDTAPQLELAVEWAQPVFSHRGPCMWLKATSRYVQLGFWRGAELEDPELVLRGDGAKIRHIRLSELDDIDVAILSKLVSQAMELNERLGDPTTPIES